MSAPFGVDGAFVFMEIVMENIKAMGLMSQVAKGLLNHSGSATAAFGYWQGG